ncbi:MAG: SPOR domain-containing protein, partial [Pseudomonadota bacterium]
MEKVLKQRLIGATILIALAVIFLPMLLVGPDDDMSVDSMDFDIPPVPDDAREVRRIPLDPEAARVRDSDVPAVRQADDQVQDDIAAAEPSDFTRPLGESAEQSAAQSSEQQPDEIVLRPEVRSDPPGSESEPEQTASLGANDPQPVASTPVSEPASQARVEASTADGSWVVQVASFGSAASAASVRQRLEALGHNVIQDNISQGGNNLIRLKTGPYADRSGADRARAQIAATVEGVAPIVRSS